MALGSQRGNFVYVDDTGKNRLVRLAIDDVISNSGLTVYDPANPPTGGIAGKLSPKRCRGVHAQGTTGARLIKRYFVCGTAASTLYATDSPQTVTISGGGASIPLSTTGRRGERITF